jgi:hypothetical protein
MILYNAIDLWREAGDGSSGYVTEIPNRSVSFSHNYSAA